MHADAFDLPKDQIYLLGHSLGPPARATLKALAHSAHVDWAKGLAASWNDAGWIDASVRVGDKIATLIGAPPASVLACDSVSINIAKLVFAVMTARKDRRVILIEDGGFPTDFYMIEGVARTLGNCTIKSAPRTALADHISDDVALLVATHVDYKSGHRLDLATLNGVARAQGCWTLWDLSHSLGAVDVAIDDSDLAVGCGYKYVCGGPGAPAFLYVAPHLQGVLQNPLSGWLGHAAPFAFEPRYRAAAGIAQWASGTPPILSMAALEAAIDALRTHDMAALARHAQLLGDMFVARVRAGVSDSDLPLITPLSARGAHIAFQHEDGFAIIQALKARGVVGDFRAPNVLRFGFAPLFLSEDQVLRAADQLIDVMQSRAFDDARFRAQQVVT
jgi:kynureninase